MANGKPKSCFEQGKPTKLFTRIYNTRGPGFDTPGVLDCNPGSVRGGRSQAIFTWLNEANWSEAAPYPPHYAENVAFAWHFNRTMFLARREEIVRICPEARLTPPPNPAENDRIDQR